MFRFRFKWESLGLSIVLIASLLAGTVAAALRVAIERGVRDPLSFRGISWSSFPIGRVAEFWFWLAPIFLLAWLGTNYYVHRRAGAPFGKLLFRDAPRFLLAAPLVGALAAFGPVDGRPPILTTIGLLYLAPLAWKLWPFLNAAVLSDKPVRRRDIFAAALAIGLGLFVLDHPRGFDGDEPHFLMITDSLWRDGDVDLTNNYREKSYAPFFRGVLVGHTEIVTDPATGRQLLRPTHYPGLPALLLPGYAVAGGGGAKLMIVLIAAAGLAGLWSLLVRLDVRPEVAGLGVIVAAVTSPFVTYGLNIYPEMAAAAMMVWAVVWLLEGDFSWKPALAVGVLAAGLPWLHLRFLPLSGALALCALVRCRLRGREVLALIAPAVVSAAGFAWYCRAVFGGLHAGMGVVLPGNHPPLTVQRSLRYFLAMFLDAQGGVFAYAPGLILAPLGGILLYRANRPALAVVALTMLAEIALIAAGLGVWHGGWTPPSRYMASVCPLLAALAVLAYDRAIQGKALRRLCHGLFAVGVLFGLLMVAEPGAMYNLYSAWSAPAITESYRWIRLEWVFPNYESGGARALVLTLLWAAAIGLLTWRALRPSSSRGAAPRP